jgi:hypothetical protein
MSVRLLLVVFHFTPLLGWNQPFPCQRVLQDSSLYPVCRISERPGLLGARATVYSEPNANVVATTSYDKGFSFSVAGLLFPYHLGVADLLKEKQVIVQGTPLSGSSGGAVAATLFALSFSEKLDIDRVLETTQTAYTELRCCRTLFR